jgi:hypothetical protein
VKIIRTKAGIAVPRTYKVTLNDAVANDFDFLASKKDWL